jgi:uncharacterized protein (DUF1810 family)
MLCKYLNHPVLGKRLLQCTNAVLAIENNIFGEHDNIKLKFSMTLFTQLPNASVGEWLINSIGESCY